MAQYKLTYFDARALAEPIRWAFSHAGVAFEDVRFTHDQWPAIKANYTWGTLPVLEVNGQVICQSNAILRYVGKQLKLAGENDFETAKVDEHVEAMADLKKSVFTAVMEKDETKKEELKATLVNETFPKYLAVWEKTLGQNGAFLVGKSWTVADFSVASYLDVFNGVFGGTLLDKTPLLKAHYNSVVNAKGIKEWIAKRPTTQF